MSSPPTASSSGPAGLTSSNESISPRMQDSDGPRRTVSGPRARGGVSISTTIKSTQSQENDVEGSSGSPIDAERVMPAPATTPATSSIPNSPGYAQPTRSTSRRLPAPPSPSTTESPGENTIKTKQKPGTPSRLKSSSSIASLRKSGSQGSMKSPGAGSGSGSPTTPKTPATPTRSSTQHQRKPSTSTTTASTNPLPLPTPSPAKRSFPSPSSLSRSLSKKGSMGSLRGSGPVGISKDVQGEGRVRKSSGLSGRAVSGAVTGGKADDGSAQDEEEEGLTVREPRRDGSNTGTMTVKNSNEIPEEKETTSSPTQAALSRSTTTSTSSALYGPSKRVPSTSTSNANSPPTSAPAGRSPSRSPTRQQVRTPEHMSNRHVARGSVSRSPPADKQDSANGIRDQQAPEEEEDEDETETTPKRGDGRSGGDRRSSVGYARLEEDDVGSRESSPIDGRRNERDREGTYLSYTDRDRVNHHQTQRHQQTGPSRTLSLAMGQRQPGDSPKDIRRWSRDSTNGLPPPPSSGFGSSMGLDMARDVSSPSAHTNLSMPAISRTSSFVRGDDANGLPGQDGPGGYPSGSANANGDIGQGTWGRAGVADVKEDSGGSSGSNKRRSGLPMEFRQDLRQVSRRGVSVQHEKWKWKSQADQKTTKFCHDPQEVPNRRSTMHTKFPTDSSVPGEIYARESPSRLAGESLMRSSSMRPGIGALDLGHNKRSSLMLQGTSRGYDQSMPSRSMSVIGRRPDEWETGSMRSGLGGTGTTDIDRAESRRRRAALLQSAGGGMSKLTPSRPGTSLRLRDPMSEPKQAPGGLVHSGSISTLRGGYQPEAPNSAPAHLRLHRQSLSLLPDRSVISNQMDSPLARYQRPMSRAATSMAGSVMMDSVSRYGGDSSSRYGDNDGASVRASGSREFPLQGTPSRIYMTRLMAALRNASSSASRDMMEACLALHEAMPPGLDENTVIRHKTQSTTTNADHISGHLKQALDLVAQMTVECEISAPEEAQEIALAYGDRLKSVLEGAMRESDSQIGGMTELFSSMSGMVSEVGRESGQLAHRTRASSGFSLDQSTSPSLYNLPRAGAGERSPSLLGGASLYRPKRSSLDLRRETTVAGTMALRNARPGSALLFRNPHTTPIDEAGSSSGSSGTRASRNTHRASESMSNVPSSTPSAPASEDRRRHSILSRLRTSPLRQTTMLPSESTKLLNGSPPSAAVSRAPTLRRQRSNASTATATARAPFKPTASGRVASTTAVSQVTASPAEPSFEDGVFVNGADYGSRSHRRLSSAASSVMDSETEPAQTMERPSRLAVIGGAYRRLSGVRGAK